MSNKTSTTSAIGLGRDIISKLSKRYVSHQTPSLDATAPAEVIVGNSSVELSESPAHTLDLGGTEIQSQSAGTAPTENLVGISSTGSASFLFLSVTVIIECLL